MIYSRSGAAKVFRMRPLNYPKFQNKIIRRNMITVPISLSVPLKVLRLKVKHFCPKVQLGSWLRQFFLNLAGLKSSGYEQIQICIHKVWIWCNLDPNLIKLYIGTNVRYRTFLQLLSKSLPHICVPRLCLGTTRQQRDQVLLLHAPVTMTSFRCQVLIRYRHCF
jgi:hypothetical protein